MRQVAIPVILAILFVAGATARAGDIRVTGQFVSEATSGPPLVVNSSDKVTGLNADKLDGFSVGDFATEGSGVGVHYKNLVGVPGKDIDQDCAEFTGCFTGDSGGFPVTITEPGSYRLSGNLDVSSLSDTDVIQVQASNVTLDLNGFAIIGPVTCTDTPVTSCTPSSGNGIGVLVDGLLSNIFLGNGSIRGMWSRGIDCRSACNIGNIKAFENRINGIEADSGDSAVMESVSSRNGGMGIDVIGIARNCLASGNGFVGIFAGQGSTVVDSTAERNGTRGIQASRSTIQGNTAIFNGSEGIFANGGSTVSGNTARSNGAEGLEVTGTATNNTAHNNTGSGIRISGLARDNDASNNGDDGIQSLLPSTIAGNHVRNNDGDGIQCSGCFAKDNGVFDNGAFGLNSTSETRDAVMSWNTVLGNTSGSTNGSININVLGDNLCEDSSC